MHNPLKYFKELVENNEIVFFRISFTKNPTYRPDDDSIDELFVDPISEREQEVRLSYKQYLINLVSSETWQAIRQLDKNVYDSGKEENNYLDKVESEVAYLLRKLSQRPDEVLCAVLEAELGRIQNHINERYRAQPTSTSIEKLVWKGNPVVFFILFQELHSQKFFGTSNRKDYMTKFSNLLYEHVDVPPINKGTEYTIKSFEQNLKPSGALQDQGYHQMLRDKIKAFLESIKDY